MASLLATTRQGLAGERRRGRPGTAFAAVVVPLLGGSSPSPGSLLMCTPRCSRCLQAKFRATALVTSSPENPSDLSETVVAGEPWWCSNFPPRPCNRALHVILKSELQPAGTPLTPVITVDTKSLDSLQVEYSAVPTASKFEVKLFKKAASVYADASTAVTTELQHVFGSLQRGLYAVSVTGEPLQLHMHL